MKSGKCKGEGNKKKTQKIVNVVFQKLESTNFATPDTGCITDHF